MVLRHRAAAAGRAQRAPDPPGPGRLGRRSRQPRRHHAHGRGRREGRATSLPFVRHRWGTGPAHPPPRRRPRRPRPPAGQLRSHRRGEHRRLARALRRTPGSARERGRERDRGHRDVRGQHLAQRPLHVARGAAPLAACRRALRRIARGLHRRGARAPARPVSGRSPRWWCSAPRGQRRASCASCSSAPPDPRGPRHDRRARSTRHDLAGGAGRGRAAGLATAWSHRPPVARARCRPGLGAPDAARPPPRHRVPLPLGPRERRMGQLLLHGGGPGRFEELEGVPLRLDRCIQLHHRRQDAGEPLARGDRGPHLRAQLVERARPPGDRRCRGGGRALPRRPPLVRTRRRAPGGRGPRADAGRRADVPVQQSGHVADAVPGPRRVLADPCRGGRPHTLGRADRCRARRRLPRQGAAGVPGDPGVRRSRTSSPLPGR